MRIRTEKAKRKLSIKNGEVVVELDAKDVMSKEDFIELYEGRIQEQNELENRMEQYREHLTKVKEFENEEKIKPLVKMLEDKEVSQKVFAILQKKQLIEQLQIWEKAKERMQKEIEDLSSMYKKLKR